MSNLYGICHRCDSELCVKTVWEPEWDGLFLCSGGGDVRRRSVRYCPKCDKVEKK